ncbi:MAG: leucyl aminopeptidase family protein [Gammaproteobacteria bacterium]|nr:MAG: leucyl aminopeptidase family protein [Gammaproteobacteria bacterium]
MNCLLTEDAADARPLVLVPTREWKAHSSRLDPRDRRWLDETGFRGCESDLALLQDAEGRLKSALLVVDQIDTWTLGDLPARLPAGRWKLDSNGAGADEIDRLALGWALGSYHFERYRSEPTSEPRPELVVPAAVREKVERLAQGITLVRDLVNTPAEDMMPEHLAAAMAEMADRHGTEWNEICGEDLLQQNYPAIHAVGRASTHAPRLLDLWWGDPRAPLLTLVGKGVCFDSGGLDLKPANAMRLMKKDMGGAAHALGLAEMIMAMRLPVRLRVLVPAVENAVSGNAFRPGDVLRTRKGLTVEIENTDAEGRLVLCDALAEACSESPALLLDFATLTGAARVALGTEVPALFSNDDALAAEVVQHAQAWSDPVWQLPLHAPYEEQLKSRIADLLNCSTGSFGGAITAALFLQRFVEESTPWMHFDLMAWNQRARPGRPEGGEAMGLLGLFDWLRKRYAGTGQV